MVASALDTILSYFNVAPPTVKRVFLPLSEIGLALHHKRAAAALAVGPKAKAKLTRLSPLASQITPAAPSTGGGASWGRPALPRQPTRPTQ